MNLHQVDTLIVGAGFAGLCAAIKLDEDGERDFVVVEKGSDVGGTWRDNTYPGAACDVPSQLYSYSFAPNPDWSMSFSPQPEIQAYIRKTAEGSGTLDRFVFNTSVDAMRWDERAQHWLVSTTGPDGPGEYAARTVISAAGGLSAPKMPEIDGIDDFAGEIFHSAEWDHDADLAGKRVAVIGTGASSIQIVPVIAKTVAHLDVYQRTAPYVIPRNDRTYSKVEKAALRHVPGLQSAYRTGIYWAREGYVPGFTLAPKLAMPAQKMGLANIRKGISDPVLRKKVTPTYQIGCKRILISNTYYPTLAQDHVDVVTDPIAKVTPTGIVTADGTVREIDVLIVATGFFTTELPITEAITGRSGQTLAARWSRTGMSAYKGTAVSDFPNLFFIVGPNTGLGHSSMVFMIESQVTYIRKAIRAMRTHGYGTVEVDESAEKQWSSEIQRRMKRTVWSTGGCASWYLDAHGNNTTLWPRTTFAFRGETADFDVAAYTVQARTASAAHTTSSTTSDSAQTPQETLA
ncbi:NAD(P)/FAD-dependent oxidoreductase [Nocardioides salsibiostraticola]